MPFAVELYFDEASTACIREWWQRLGEIGFSSMIDCGARPHVSLAVCEQIDMPAATALVGDFAAKAASFELSLASCGLFHGDPAVLFLAPKVTASLLDWHARFHEVFPSVATGLWTHYLPVHWVPHCTLATRIPKERIGVALDGIRGVELPLQCQVTSVGLVELRPVKLLCEYALR